MSEIISGMNNVRVCFGDIIANALEHHIDQDSLVSMKHTFHLSAAVRVMLVSLLFSRLLSEGRV